MIQTIKQHPLISIGVGMFSVASIGFFINQSAKNTKIKQKTLTEGNDFINQQKQIRQNLIKLQKTRQLYKQKSKEFTLNYVQEVSQKILTEDCIIRLLQTCNQLFDKEQLQKIYKVSRQARRNIFSFILPNTQNISKEENRFEQKNQNIMNNSFENDQIYRKQTGILLTKPQCLRYSQLYYRFVCAFQEQIKYFIQKTQKDFVVFLNIPFTLITESIDYHLAKQDNEVFKNSIQEWTSSVRQNLKTYLSKYNQTIELNQIKAILQFEVKQLTNKQSKLIEMIKKLGITNDQELQCLPTFLAVYLEDLVYKKYNVEQQQMTIQIMHISTNQDMRTLVQQFQYISEKLVKQMYEQVKRQTILDNSDYF